MNKTDLKKWWQKMRMVPFFWQGADAWERFAKKAPLSLIKEVLAEIEEKNKKKFTEKRWFLKNLLSHRIEKEEKKLKK